MSDMEAFAKRYRLIDEGWSFQEEQSDWMMVRRVIGNVLILAGVGFASHRWLAPELLVPACVLASGLLIANALVVIHLRVVGQLLLNRRKQEFWFEQQLLALRELKAQLDR